MQVSGSVSSLLPSEGVWWRGEGASLKSGGGGPYASTSKWQLPTGSRAAYIDDVSKALRGDRPFSDLTKPPPIPTTHHAAPPDRKPSASIPSESGASASPQPVIPAGSFRPLREEEGTVLPPSPSSAPADEGGIHYPYVAASVSHQPGRSESRMSTPTQGVPLQVLSVLAATEGIEGDDDDDDEGACEEEEPSESPPRAATPGAESGGATPDAPPSAYSHRGSERMREAERILAGSGNSPLVEERSFQASTPLRAVAAGLAFARTISPTRPQLKSLPRCHEDLISVARESVQPAARIANTSNTPQLRPVSKPQGGRAAGRREKGQRAPSAASSVAAKGSDKAALQRPPRSGRASGGRKGSSVPQQREEVEGVAEEEGEEVGGVPHTPVRDEGVDAFGGRGQTERYLLCIGPRFKQWNLYSKPSITSAVLAAMPDGAEIEASEDRQGWLHLAGSNAWSPKSACGVGWVPFSEIIAERRHRSQQQAEQPSSLRPGSARTSASPRAAQSASTTAAVSPFTSSQLGGPSRSRGSMSPRRPSRHAAATAARGSLSGGRPAGEGPLPPSPVKPPFGMRPAPATPAPTSATAVPKVPAPPVPQAEPRPAPLREHNPNQPRRPPPKQPPQDACIWAPPGSQGKENLPPQHRRASAAAMMDREAQTSNPPQPLAVASPVVLPADTSLLLQQHLAAVPSAMVSVPPSFEPAWHPTSVDLRGGGAGVGGVGGVAGGGGELCASSIDISIVSPTRRKSNPDMCISLVPSVSGREAPTGQQAIRASGSHAGLALQQQRQQQHPPAHLVQVGPPAVVVDSRASPVRGSAEGRTPQLREKQSLQPQHGTTEREIESTIRDSFLEQMKEVAKRHVEGVEAAMEKTLKAAKDSAAAAAAAAVAASAQPQHTPVAGSRSGGGAPSRRPRSPPGQARGSALRKPLSPVRDAVGATPHRAAAGGVLPRKALSPPRPKKVSGQQMQTMHQQSQQAHNGRIQQLLERYNKMQGGRDAADYVRPNGGGAQHALLAQQGQATRPATVQFVDADGDAVVFAVDPQTWEVVVTVGASEICRPRTVTVDRSSGILDLDDGAAVCPLALDTGSLVERLAALLDTTPVRHNLHSRAPVAENWV